MNFLNLSNNNSKMNCTPSRNNMNICPRQSNNADSSINKLINTYLYGFYAYLIISMYFKKKNICLFGVSNIFQSLSNQKKNLAQELIDYQNSKNVNIQYENINVIKTASWSISQALKNAIDFEQSISKDLNNIYKNLQTLNKTDFSNFIQKILISSNSDLLKELEKLHTQSKRCGTGAGEFLFDQNLLKNN